MDTGESHIDDTVLALLDCLALFTKELSGLIASDNLKYIDRKKISGDIHYISSQIVAIRNSFSVIKSRNIQGPKKPSGGPEVWPVHNN